MRVCVRGSRAYARLRAPTAHARAFLESVVVHLLSPNDLSRAVAQKMLRAPHAVAAARSRKAAAGAADGTGHDGGKGSDSGKESGGGSDAANTADATARVPAAAAEAGYVHSAQLTRLLVGDELGDALDLPWSLPARRAARRELTVLRWYTRACGTWLIGGVLTWLHTLVLRAVQWRAGEHTFPMLSFPGTTARTGGAEDVESTCKRGAGARVSLCPMGHGGG